ncbi:MAG: hypothetical protein Q8K79_22390 [Solirubrobacteraceae bacterium]|nr:hypothetical protein [Solirubrobacteraceae bacterium]
MAWLLIALLAAVVLLAGWKGGRVAMAAAAAIVLGWTTTAALVASDYRDAEGFFDCGIHCTSLQDAVGFVAFAGPAAFVVLLLGSLAGYLTRRIRS